VQGVPSNTTAGLPGFLAAVSESSLARFIVALLRDGKGETKTGLRTGNP
jgi:hypothetical protein